MSDTVLRLYSADPDYAPDPPTAARAKEAAKRLFPDCDEVEVEVYPRVTLIDCGENLVRVVCPHCGTELSYDWWAEQMDCLAGGAMDGVDVETNLIVPCCEQHVTLRTLRYDWPVGFARFSVDVWSPAPWPDDDPDVSAKALGDALHTEMRGLWAHY